MEKKNPIPESAASTVKEFKTSPRMPRGIFTVLIPQVVVFLLVTT